MFIKSNSAPNWQFVFFHIDPIPDIKEGSSVGAGQLVGWASSDIIANFDYGLKDFSIRGQVFDSPFFHMAESVLDEYKARGFERFNRKELK